MPHKLRTRTTTPSITLHVTAINLQPYTHPKWSLINDLRGNDNFIVIEANKNLGGAITDVSNYTERGIREHLGDKNVYKPVSLEFVRRRLQCLCYKIYVFTNKWRNKGVMSKAEDHHYLNLNKACHRYQDKVARFRMSLKAHKTPYKMRPIVCCVGAFMNLLSKWLDFWLQKLKPFIPTYIKDSTNLLDLLDKLGPLPPDHPMLVSLQPAPTQCTLTLTQTTPSRSLVSGSTT